MDQQSVDDKKEFVSEGEVLEKSPDLFFVSFRGKQFGYFSSRVGAEEFLKVLQQSVS